MAVGSQDSQGLQPNSHLIVCSIFSVRLESAQKSPSQGLLVAFQGSFPFQRKVTHNYVTKPGIRMKITDQLQAHNQRLGKKINALAVKILKSSGMVWNYVFKIQIN